MNEITSHYKVNLAKTIKETLGQWYYMPSEELQKQIKEAEQINNNISTCIKPSTSLGISYKTHSGASIYTSRLLNYNNLPEPKNSYDYYDERNDNIISIKASASLSLHIDISQSKINDNNLFKLKTSDVCYEKNDSIININSSVSLQIDISQLNFNEDGEDDRNSKSKGKEKI
ncbi:uncharacterized protein OCT59_012432 [Rhizophagus irregularis]|uniref:uncharacterized protein n=1 Tax=Rhizophagus irregularis TaxID=588596 RepID=UPI00331A7222|nr:hypothetical protein OCT59_012432 [Rhizophagus irregularis]